MYTSPIGHSTRHHTHKWSFKLDYRLLTWQCSNQKWGLRAAADSSQFFHICYEVIFRKEIGGRRSLSLRLKCGGLIEMEEVERECSGLNVYEYIAAWGSYGFAAWSGLMPSADDNIWETFKLMSSGIDTLLPGWAFYWKAPAGYILLKCNLIMEQISAGK